MRNLFTMYKMNKAKNAVSTYLLYTNNLQLFLLDKEPSNSKVAQRREVIMQEKLDKADARLETPES
jgi:hypothetical protein